MAYILLQAKERGNCTLCNILRLIIHYRSGRKWEGQNKTLLSSVALPEFNKMKLPFSRNDEFMEVWGSIGLRKHKLCITDRGLHLRMSLNCELALLGQERSSWLSAQTQTPPMSSPAVAARGRSSGRFAAWYHSQSAGLLRSCLPFYQQRLRPADTGLFFARLTPVLPTAPGPGSCLFTTLPVQHFIPPWNRADTEDGAWRKITLPSSWRSLHFSRALHLKERCKRWNNPLAAQPSSARLPTHGNQHTPIGGEMLMLANKMQFCAPGNICAVSRSFFREAPLTCWQREERCANQVPRRGFARAPQCP